MNSPSQRLAKACALAIIIACAAVPAARADYVYVSGINLGLTGTFYFGQSGEGVVHSSSHGLIVQGANASAQATNILQEYGYIQRGFNAGNWLGTGLTSHQAAVDAGVNGVLGVMLYDNNQLNYPTWQGKTGLNADPLFNQVLMRMDYMGDYDGNGSITVDDYGLLDFYFTLGLTRQGDITGDNAITVDDYGYLDYVFSTQAYGNLGNAAPLTGDGGKVGVVPEPASGLLCLFGVIGFAAARGRKRSV